MAAITIPGMFLTGNHASRPSSGVGKGTIYACSTHTKLYQTTDTGATWVDWFTAAGSGGVATDTLWDAAGDLAVGSGADTAAKLSLGNAGAHLSRINGAVAWDAGTSSPTVASGDRWYRTDHIQEYRYDGTNKLSVVQYEKALETQQALPLTGSGVSHRGGMPSAQGGSDVWLVSLRCQFYVDAGTALSGSHKWEGFVIKSSAGGTSALGTFTINSGASSQWRVATDITVGAAAVAGTYFELECGWVKTGTPGNLYACVSVIYRIKE